MIPDIFDIEKNKVIINANCLLIPELKAVYEKYKNPIPAFSYLYYRYSPKSAYINVPEEEKDDIIMEDFPGEYTLEDDVMINASKKLKTLYITPTYQYYLDNKMLLEKLGKFARDANITTGRDGNIGAFISQVRNVGKTISEFKILEKVVLQELSETNNKIRGNKKLAYDQ